MLTRTFWFGRRIVGEITWAPTVDRSTTLAGLPSSWISTPGRTRYRGARRVPCQSSGLGRLAVATPDAAGGAAALVLAAAWAGASTFGRLRHLPRVVAGVRHHADFGVPELRVGLDAVDERGAARRRGKQPLEHDRATGRCSRIAWSAWIGSVSANVEQLAFVGEPLLERRHQVGGGNHDRGHPAKCITQPANGRGRIVHIMTAWDFHCIRNG